MENIDIPGIVGSIWLGFILISFAIGFVSFFWGLFDLFYLSRYEGKMKRGFRIWSKSLSDDWRQYLLSLSSDVIDTKKTWFSERKTGFIRTDNREAIIYSRRPHWGTSWPYVGYVDLSETDSVLEFRSSLAMHLFLLPFIATIVFIPLVFLMMIFNYYMETSAIENYIKEKVAANKK